MKPSPPNQPPVPTTGQTLQHAIACHQAGQLQEADRLYRTILQADPDHPEANHNLGVLAMQSGQPGVALPHFKSALEANPGQGQYWLSYIEALSAAGNADEARQVLEQGRQCGLQGDAVDALAGHLDGSTPAPREVSVLVALFGEGRYAEVEALARSMTERYPRYGVGWKALGVAYTQMRRIADALIPLQKAAALSPSDAESHNNLGAAFQELGRLDEAEASYRQALQINPDYADAHSNLGVTLKDMGRLDEAEASCRHALRIKPDDAEAHGNLGVILMGLGRLNEAEAVYRQALQIRPDFAEVHANLGGALQGLGRLKDAEASYRQALRLKPDYPQAHTSLGTILDDLGRRDDAEASYRMALQFKPDFEEALCRLGMLLHKQLRNAEAKDCFKRAKTLRPDSLRARLCDVSGTIPILYDSAAEIDPARKTYAGALDELVAWFGARPSGKRQELWRDVGYMQNFYLAYQARDDRQLQDRFGRLTCAVMADGFPEWAAAPAMPSPPTDGSLRIGIVSAHFRDHSNWKIPVRGWVEQMDRSRFRLFGYHTGHVADGETERARRSFDHFYDKRPFREFCRTILADQLDVLIYPGLGMDQDTWQMAALRLAPVQCTSWGHPITSGLPTVDYFLSSDLMEPPDAAGHYSEKLVRLPNLSIHYTLPVAKPIPLTRKQFGWPEDAVLFFCPQSLQKYLPQNDTLLVEIARQLPLAKFVFLANGPAAVPAFLMNRLERAFAQAGMNGKDHLVLIPALDSDQFQAMHGIVDVLLDTPDWSGCNSSLELLAHGLPVVTLPGQFMRGRHTLAILRMMGMDELIAATPEAYVSLAVRLGSDPDWRKQLRARIVDSYPGVCSDVSAVRGLEKFLVDAVAQQRGEASGAPAKQ
jgi:predicted O-linked N-acetylglucosamine transferase (SPINDLY family)